MKAVFKLAAFVNIHKILFISKCKLYTHSGVRKTGNVFHFPNGITILPKKAFKVDTLNQFSEHDSIAANLSFFLFFFKIK